jgi:asparagine synthase (glutamine-hydrolysing)
VAKALNISLEVAPGDEFDVYEWAEHTDWLPPEPTVMPAWGWQMDYARRVASVCPQLFTGLDGDTLFGASVALHWRQLARTGRWRRLARDLGWYLRVRHRFPPFGIRTWVRRRWQSPAPLPPLPPWLAPDFVRRGGLRARWEEYHRPRWEEGPRETAARQLSSPLWANVFDHFDPGWTGTPLNYLHPLMDLRVVRFLLALPAVPWCVNKELFRASLRGVVPDAVWRRPKTPLAADPVALRLSRRPDRWVGGVGLEPELAGMIDRGALDKLKSLPTTWKVWESLPPFSLNCWLHFQKRKGNGGRGRQGLSSEILAHGTPPPADAQAAV